jgi:NAD(P)H-hydrate repair Nnr-like enzyme with NAD(P)H-hydrate dehydratase domain
MPITFDADFFWYLTLPQANKLREVVSNGAKNCILTPNKLEFKNMAKWYLKEESEESKSKTKEPVVEKELLVNKKLTELCSKMNGVTIIQKVKSNTHNRELMTLYVMANDYST